MADDHLGEQGGGGGGGAAIATQRRPSIQELKRHQRLRTKGVFHVVHRFAVFLCALLYITLSFSAAYDAIGLLRGRQNLPTPVEEDTFDLMATVLGNTTIRQSPLVANALANSTTPLVNGTLYVTARDKSSFEQCSHIEGRSQKQLHGDTFLRSVYAALVDGTAYHIASISTTALQLVAPLVDCTATKLMDGDDTSGRFFYLVRQRSNPENVSVLVVTLSNQQYMIPEQEEEGPAGVVVLQLIHDMRATDVGHHFAVSMGYPYMKFAFRPYNYVNTTNSGLWSLEIVPRNDRENIKLLQTASRTGFYIKAESEQSNVNNYVWIREKVAHLAVARLRWVSIPVLRDSWGWVHSVQFFMGMNTLSNQLILCQITYHSIRAGKWWIGDAFAAISIYQVVAGVAVLFSWFMNEFWSLHEFSLQEANVVSGFESKIIYEAHTRADMLTIYLSACGIIGRVFRERIDPLFAVACFLLGYEARVGIIRLFPALRADISTFSSNFYFASASPALPGQEKISPMRFWTTRPLGKRNYAFVFKCLFPIYITLVFIVVYVALRKVYRHFYPESVHVQRNTSGTATSENEKSLIAQKRVLTLFEIATGAQLENRFGVVSDFETCVFVKGTKFASADGIYTTGFVIANGKFLLQTRDYWSIVFMKMIRRRYKNIYVYDVDGRTVQQTARLVYPHTLSVADLLAINVAMLS